MLSHRESAQGVATNQSDVQLTIDYPPTYGSSHEICQACLFEMNKF